jgi:hypothetical protein
MEGSDIEHVWPWQTYVCQRAMLSLEAKPPYQVAGRCAPLVSANPVLPGLVPRSEIALWLGQRLRMLDIRLYQILDESIACGFSLILHRSPRQK